MEGEKWRGEYFRTLRAERLKGSPARPIRITKSVIGRELQQASRLYHQLDKLPLTAKALDDVVESPEENGIRKLWWEAERFRKAEKLPNRTQLIQSAGVDDLATQPQVRQAIETILACFRQSGSLAIESVFVPSATPVIQETIMEIP